MARDHYIPQLYLKGFIDPASKTYPDPYLWIVDLQDQTVRRRAPKNVAYIKGFYDWQEVGDDELPAIEEMYSEIEGQAAPIIYRLREYKQSGIQLTLEEKLTLSYFLGIQPTRDPRSRGNLANGLKTTATDAMRNWLEELVNDEARFKEHFKNCNKEEILAAIKETFVVPKLNAVLSGTLLLASDLAKQLFLMEWLFLIPETDFLTTDRPVALFTKDGKPPTDFRSEVSIFFPISPSLLLSIQNERPPQHIGYVKSAHTEMINRKILSVANQYVFCSSEELGKWALGQMPIYPDDIKGGSLVIYPVK